MLNMIKKIWNCIPYNNTINTESSHKADDAELPPKICIRLKHILINNTVMRRINLSRDKIHGNHYVMHFLVKHTNGSNDDIDDYIGVINVGQILVPKSTVGKLVKITINHTSSETITFLKEKHVLDYFRQDIK